MYLNILRQKKIERNAKLNKKVICTPIRRNSNELRIPYEKTKNKNTIWWQFARSAVQRGAWLYICISRMYLYTLAKSPH